MRAGANPIKRLSVSLPANEAEMLESLAHSESMPMNDVIRKAIRVYYGLADLSHDGRAVKLLMPDGERLRVIL